MNVKTLLFSILTLILLTSCCKNQNMSEKMVFVEGGLFVNFNSSLFSKKVKISDFYISKYEVTQKEWKRVMGENPSIFKGDDLPVERISWYDSVKYCNKRSIVEGLDPYYNIDENKKDPNNKNLKDEIKWIVTVNKRANGYRLPLEREWEYAASGGQLSKSYIYSGSNNLDEVGWYWQNSGDEYLEGFWHYRRVEGNNCKTHSVGMKKPNELGIYDMSGNVREWCFDWFEKIPDTQSGVKRSIRGGGWLGGDMVCKISIRSQLNPFSNNARDTGLRVCRSR